MKRYVWALLALAAVVSFATVQAKDVAGHSHTSFTTVFQETNNTFETFSIANTGSNILWVRFAYGSPAVASLTTDSVPVPAGLSWSPPDGGKLGKTAHAYWLSSASGTTAVTSYD